MKAAAIAATLARKTGRGFRTVGGIVSFQPEEHCEEIEIAPGQSVPGLKSQTIIFEVISSLRRPFASPGTWSLRHPGREYLFHAIPEYIASSPDGLTRVLLIVTSPITVRVRTRTHAYPRWGGRS